MDGPSDNIRTAIGVCVGLTSGLIIMYYFVRLCRTIAMFPKSDAEEVLPAYQPPSTLPATGNFCYHEGDDEESHFGHRPSRTGARPAPRDFFRELRRERVPTTAFTITIPNAPVPTYSTLSRNSGYYHNGEMTQVGNSSTLPPGTFVIPLPAAPTRPPRSARRSAGLGFFASRLSGQAPLLPVVNSNAPTETRASEPPPPSYLDVVGESSSQPSYHWMNGSQRIAHTAVIV
ncbi:MAG: hypothetical protein JOS17DRAFT_735446 [Linnemannia elongata]|nr:MAG: hypothetical protein JOS17DRAFT_735446 [Linnemannia elongata]